MPRRLRGGPKQAFRCGYERDTRLSQKGCEFAAVRMHVWVCDGVTDLSYRGTALFEFEGQVQVRGQFARGEHHIRLSIFWLPSGGATAKEDWIEQTSTSVAIDFPSSFRVRIFEPPKASHFYSVAAVGRLMLYDDLNKNRQWDKDEPFVGALSTRALFTDATTQRVSLVS